MGALWLPTSWAVGEQRSGPPPPEDADPAVTAETNEVAMGEMGEETEGRPHRASWASRPPL